MRISDWSSDVCSSDLLVLQTPQEENGLKKIRLTPLFFRRIHKWVGLILGLQFVLWTLSGSVMALLDKDKVAAHAHDMGHAHPLPGGEYFDVGALSTGDPVLGAIGRASCRERVCQYV